MIRLLTQISFWKCHMSLCGYFWYFKVPILSASDKFIFRISVRNKIILKWNWSIYNLCCYLCQTCFVICTNYFNFKLYTIFCHFFSKEDFVVLSIGDILIMTKVEFAKVARTRYFGRANALLGISHEFAAYIL